MSEGEKDVDEPQQTTTDLTAEQERAERVARVIESVRSGTYQVRSDVAATRLIEAALRQPRKR